jgi:uncharacterized protein HemX
MSNIDLSQYGAIGVLLIVAITGLGIVGKWFMSTSDNLYHEQAKSTDKFLDRLDKKDQDTLRMLESVMTKHEKFIDSLTIAIDKNSQMLDELKNRMSLKCFKLTSYDMEGR